MIVSPIFFKVNLSNTNLAQNIEAYLGRTLKYNFLDNTEFDRNLEL